MLLEVNGLSLVLDHHAILHDVVLTIEEREFHDLLGASGSGYK